MKFTVPNPSLEIEFRDEAGPLPDPAILEIKKDGELLVAVQAIIERKKGADGGWYNCVVFRRLR